ncbi:hypothetical protein B0T16DRAFT_462791 [Cercophora newfieldiana]|uniref:Uncharacterized protein n=1 Tax=Cercophora newfieldiana TaxID=92897 RepID=A0AA39XRW1_9PEZI|nr:hypothetical protein B0T16DRAFT_462791 [Cercophora newfieldiana]
MSSSSKWEGHYHEDSDSLSQDDLDQNELLRETRDLGLARETPKPSLRTSASGSVATSSTVGPTVPQAVVTNEESLRELRVDEDQWREWHDQDLPGIISQLFKAPNRQPEGQHCSMQPRNGNLGAGPTVHCARLQYEFEEDTFVKVQWRDPNTAFEARYVVLIHSIHQGNGQDDVECSIESPHLCVTKYTLLREQDHGALFGNPNPRVPMRISSPAQEYLLHCSPELLCRRPSPSNMDAPCEPELMLIRDIMEVDHHEDFEMLHCANEPTLSMSGMSQGYCRFARSINNQTMVFVPLPPALLPRRERRHRHKSPLEALVKNAEPQVVDFTPGVLGTAEGFVNAGFNVLAALGFDATRHHTWRAQNPGCPVFDGDISTTVGEIESGCLAFPEMSPGQPVVACLAGANTMFRLHPENEQMPSIETFLKPLEDMVSFMWTELASKFHFAVLQMPIAALHDNARDILFNHIHKCVIDVGLSVALHVVALSDYGIRQDRYSLVIIVSRYPGLHLVLPEFDVVTSAADLTLAKLLGDLAISNTRSNYQDSNGKNLLAMFLSGGENVYNHATGRTFLAPRERILVDINEGADNSSTVPICYPLSRPLVHKGRGDLLTVREVARIQGISDSTIFYGPDRMQYSDVLAAHPPIVSEVVGRMLRRVIDASGRTMPTVGGDDATVVGQMEKRRPRKRARVEDAEDEEG